MKQSTDYPEEFKQVWFQAVVDKIEWKFMTVKKAQGYRNYLNAFKRAYQDEARPNFELLNNVTTSIETLEDDTAILTLTTRHFIKPETPLKSMKELDELLASESDDYIPNRTFNDAIRESSTKQPTIVEAIEQIEDKAKEILKPKNPYLE